MALMPVMASDQKTEAAVACVGKAIQITPVQQMVSSCSGAILTSMFVTPFDVVKIRLQAQKKPFVKGDCFLYCNGLMDHLCTCLNGNAVQKSSQWYKRPSRFAGTVDAFIKIPRNEGLLSLWSGLPPTLVMAVPATVVYFTCYEHAKEALGYDRRKSSDWWKPIVSGITARVWATSVISPIEMVRTKMQSEQLSYRAIMKAVVASVEQGGIKRMWMGWGPTLLRDVPFSGLYWFGYESVKSWVLVQHNRTELTFTESFLGGAISGTTAAVITLPFDVIKTHRQIELGQVMGTSRRASSTWVLISNLYRQQGFRVLFTGLVPRISKVAPACAIMISSFEYSKKLFRKMNYEKCLQTNSSQEMR
ncbi:hypothetical protein ScPMuIL_012661 [Solemya velum]